MPSANHRLPSHATGPNEKRRMRSKRNADDDAAQRAERERPDGRADRGRDDAVAEQRVPAEPLAVPEDEAVLAEQLGAKDLRREVGPAPAERDREQREHARDRDDRGRRVGHPSTSRRRAGARRDGERAAHAASPIGRSATATGRYAIRPVDRARPADGYRSAGAGDVRKSAGTARRPVASTAMTGPMVEARALTKRFGAVRRGRRHRFRDRAGRGVRLPRPERRRARRRRCG